LDADDSLDPSYLKILLPLAAECPKGGEFYYSDWRSGPDGRAHHAERWDVEALKKKALFAITFLHSRAAFDTIEGFDEKLEWWEDWDYVLRLGLAGYRGVRVPKALFTYRYDTGARREHSLRNKDELIRLFRSKYEAATPEKEMG
jgi:GT2 family glycosyltransferase